MLTKSAAVMLDRLLSVKKLYLPIAEQAMSSSFYRQQRNNATIANYGSWNSDRIRCWPHNYALKKIMCK